MSVNIKLKPHNRVIYDKVVKLLNENRACFLLQSYGTFREEVIDKIVSKNIKESIKYFGFCDSELKEHFEKLNVSCIDYDTFLNMSRAEIANLDISFGIFDDCFFLLNGEISSRIKLLTYTHPLLTILGTSDVLLEDQISVSLFSNSLCSYTLDNALADGVLKFPKYVNCNLNVENMVLDLYEKVKKRSLNNKDYLIYLNVLEDAKEKLSDVSSFYDDISFGKYIYLLDDDSHVLEVVNGFSDKFNVYKEDEIDKFRDCLNGVLVTSNNYFYPDLNGIVLDLRSSDFLLKFSEILSFYKDLITDDFLVVDLGNNINDIRALEKRVAKLNGKNLNVSVRNKDLLEILDYVEGFYNNKKLGHIERCFEFLDVCSFANFSDLDNYYFSDGVSIDFWWNENKKRVIKDKSDVCKNINKFYKKRQMLSFDDKKREFLDYILINGVPKMVDDVCFSDDVNMGAWWVSNKNTIFSLDDDVSLDIINATLERRKVI